MAKDSETLKASASKASTSETDQAAQSDADGERQRQHEVDLLAAEEAAAVYFPYLDAVMGPPAFRLGAAAKFKSMKNVNEILALFYR